MCSTGDVLRSGADRKQQAPLLLVRGALRLEGEGVTGTAKGVQPWRVGVVSAAAFVATLHCLGNANLTAAHLPAKYVLCRAAVFDEESGYGGSPAAHTMTAVALLGVPPVQLASTSYPAVRMTAATFSLVYQVHRGIAGISLCLACRPAGVFHAATSARLCLSYMLFM